MAKRTKQNGLDLKRHFRESVKPVLKRAAWKLRVTEHKDKPAPVFIVKEYRPVPGTDQENPAKKTVLLERGLIYGDPLVRLLPVIRKILSRVQDERGINLELHRYVKDLPLTFRGNLPLDEESAYKLGLIFKLQERLKELDRVELLARRVERFSREEAAYWFSRITDFGAVPNRWAQAGLRLMLAGQPHDPNVDPMLEKLRQN